MKFRNLWFATTAALYFFALSLASTTAVAQTMIGPLQNSCETWTEVRRTRQTQTSQALEFWVTGFLSGANVFDDTDINFLKGMDSNAIYAWIDNYCKANPLERLPDAAYALTRELKDRAKRK